MVRPNPKAPAGVRRSPSRFFGETPRPPPQAAQGSETATQHSPDFLQRRSSPRIEVRRGTTTVTSCVPSAADIWFAIVAGHAAVAGAGAQSATKIESRSAFRIDPADYARSTMRLFLLALLVAAPAQAPPFEHSVARVTAAQLPYSWRAGCPVSPAQLRRVRLTYWGFDGKAHSGSLDLRADSVQEIVQVFRKLYAARFPIRRMRPVDVYGADDRRSMAADNTSGFNCRFVSGTRRWSQHAYGEAIDVNPVENPYVYRGAARPPAGARYVDRSRVRPGMAVSGGVLVRAFAAVGWQWGGVWRGSPDYH